MAQRCHVHGSQCPVSSLTTLNPSLIAFKTLQAGLLAMLGDSSDFDTSASPTINDMATHARIFYYAQRVGVIIDFATYKSWLEGHPNHKRPVFRPDPEPQSSAAQLNRLSSSSLSTSSISPKSATMQDGPISTRHSQPFSSLHTNQPTVSQLAEQLDHLRTGPSALEKGKGREVPESSPLTIYSWQTSAPTAQLYISHPDRDSLSAIDSVNDATNDTPDYPIRFAEMLRMIQDGIDVPGIRHVPDTIVRNSVRPLSFQQSIPESRNIFPSPARVLYCAILYGSSRISSLIMTVYHC